MIFLSYSIYHPFMYINHWIVFILEVETIVANDILPIANCFDEIGLYIVHNTLVSNVNLSDKSFGKQIPKTVFYTDSLNEKIWFFPPLFLNREIMLRIFRRRQIIKRKVISNGQNLLECCGIRKISWFFLQNSMSKLDK